MLSVGTQGGAGLRHNQLGKSPVKRYQYHFSITKRVFAVFHHYVVVVVPKCCCKSNMSLTCLQRLPSLTSYRPQKTIQVSLSDLEKHYINHLATISHRNDVSAINCPQLNKIMLNYAKRLKLLFN